MEMEPTDSCDLFFDAVDSFFTPPNSQQTLDYEPIKSPPPIDNETSSSTLSSSSSSLQRRRRREPSTESPIKSRPISSSIDSNNPRERRDRISHQLKDPEVSTASSSTLTSDPAIVTSRDEIRHQQDPNGGSILFSIAGFVIKAILFQLNLLVACFTIPFRLLYFSFLLVNDPFGALRSARNLIKERFLWVWTGFSERISPWVSNQLAVRLALGCFWSVYVGFVLFGILVTAFLGGSLLMRSVVEEPLRVVRELNFDYTKPSPDALVPIDSVGGVGCNFDGFGKQFGGQVVPVNHRLQLIVSLTLPESDYNRKLGMFQVRAELLAANGKVTYSSSQACMLRFKSSHFHFIETFLKTGTLLAGYSSESQILRIKMTGFVERNEPTVCVRVILEPRAEYRPGAGIPEIYAASLKLESQLPFVKRIIWNWRRTVFIWVGMGLFFLELLIVLICCRPVIIPRTRPSSESPSRT